MIDSTKQYCEDICAGSSYDQGIDDYVEPCNVDLFTPPEDDMGDDYHSYYYDSLFGHYNGYDSLDNSDDADHLDDEDLGQPVTLPVGGVVNPFEYWTRGTDDSSYWYPSLVRGPLGANTLPNLDAGERWNETIWDTAHNYDSTNSYASNYWPWLVPTYSVGGSEMEPSDFYIFTYKYSGIEGLNSINSAGKFLSL